MEAPRPAVRLPAAAATTTTTANHHTDVDDNNTNLMVVPSHGSRLGFPSTCAVCRTHEAKYTCPRCKVRYCSPDCYRHHTTSITTFTTTTTSKAVDGNYRREEDASPCSEAFFRDRVNAVLKLEVAEQRHGTRALLQRQRSKKPGDDDVDDDDDVVDTPMATTFFENEFQNNEAANNIISQEELLEVLSKLEAQEEVDNANGDGDGTKEWRRLLSPALRAQFERDVMKGEAQELIIQEWHPWWRRQLVVVGTIDGESEFAEKREKQPPPLQDSLPSSCKLTLDERLLRVPSFVQLRRNRSHLDDQLLLYNLVDMLYATCWTLRLYHGTNNILVDHHLTQEAAGCLLTVSSVLSDDRRFTELSEVLSHSTAASTAAACDHPNAVVGCNTPWVVLVEDVALLVSSHRTVGRALLEAIDVVKAAIRQLKMAIVGVDVPRNGENELTLNKIRRMRKKMEFYLSWTQQTDLHLFGSELRQGILAWMEDWKLTSSEPTVELQE